MSKVSLDEYRTKGCKVFSGYERGVVVGKEIKRVYGDDVEIEIPSDVYSISRSFQRGFNRILPDKLDWNSELTNRIKDSENETNKSRI